ncbi:unnamed protein product, partial [Effrenium voratum]
LGDSREHASEFKKARNIHVGEDDRDFVTPADVQSSERRGLEVYSEVGLVSESEFQRLVGCLPSSLGVKALGQEKSNNPRRFTPTNEEGQEQKSLHLLSLEGLSCCEIHSIRKVKLYWQVNLQMTEALLEQAGQLSDLHPHRVYQYNQKTMLETLPDGLRATGRLKLNTVAALREKHASLQAARQSKEVADPLEDGDASAGADDVYLASTEDLDTVMQSLDPDMAKVAKAKDLAASIKDQKEGIILQHRIEDCEQAAALCSPGILRLPKRDLQLNLKRMQRGKHDLPVPLQLQAALRSISDKTQELVEAPSLSAKTTIADVVDKLCFWRAFLQIDDQESMSFDVLEPSFVALAAALSDTFTGMALEDSEPNVGESKEKGWEAFATSISGALGNDAFFQMVQCPKKNPALQELCEGLLKAFMEDGADSIEYPSPHLKEAALRVKRASGCIVSLLVPVAGHCGSSIEDVFHITGYEGQDMLESTLAMSVQSVEQWQVLVDETLKTAAKTKQLAPEVHFLQEQLENSSEPCEVDEALRQALAQLNNYKASLRQGATRSLEKLLSNRVKLVAKQMMSKPAVSLKPEDVDLLTRGISYFLAEEGMADFQREFESFKESIASDLSLSRLEDFAQSNLDLQQFDNHSQLSVLLHETEGQLYSKQLIEKLQQLCCVAFQVLDSQVDAGEAGGIPDAQLTTIRALVTAAFASEVAAAKLQAELDLLKQGLAVKAAEARFLSFGKTTKDRLDKDKGDSILKQIFAARGPLTKLQTKTDDAGSLPQVEAWAEDLDDASFPSFGRHFDCLPVAISEAYLKKVSLLKEEFVALDETAGEVCKQLHCPAQSWKKSISPTATLAEVEKVAQGSILKDDISGPTIMKIIQQ